MNTDTTLLTYLQMVFQLCPLPLDSSSPQDPRQSHAGHWLSCLLSLLQSGTVPSSFVFPDHSTFEEQWPVALQNVPHLWCVWCFSRIRLRFCIFGTNAYRSDFLNLFARCYFPDQELNLCPLQWECGVLTTGPPGSPQQGCCPLLGTSHQEECDAHTSHFCW